jgi:hypothetical protein
MLKVRKHLTYANVVASLALFVALGGSAYAVSKIDGSALVNRSVAGKKLKADTVTGREIRESTLGACPAGTRIFTGACVETALRGRDLGWQDSAAACKAAGRRLPTVGELWLFRNRSGITLGGAAGRSEWAQEVVDDARHVSVDDAGANALTTDVTALPYRCVAAPRN